MGLVVAFVYGLVAILDLNVDINLMIFIFNDLIFDKFVRSSGDISSVGARVENLSFLIETLAEHPAGVGAQPELITNNLSVGIIGSLVESGLLGSLGYILIFSALFGMIWRVSHFQKNSDVLLALAFSVLSFMIMSFQRTEMFNIYVAVFMCGLFVRGYLEQIKQQNKNKWALL